MYSSSVPSTASFRQSQSRNNNNILRIIYNSLLKLKSIIIIIIIYILKKINLHIAFIMSAIIFIINDSEMRNKIYYELDYYSTVNKKCNMILIVIEIVLID